MTEVPSRRLRPYIPEPLESAFIHVAARKYGRTQKCRRCGYVLHNWGDKTDWPEESYDHYWKAGDGVVTLIGGSHRSSVALA